MCELPVDLFPALAMHLEREDVLALSVSCASAAKGLTETREPLVDWIVDRCVRLHCEAPLTAAVSLTSDNGGREGHADVVRSALQRLLVRAPATCVDAVRALCAASARGYERAVDLLLEEGDGSPLSGLAAAPCPTAQMAAVHAEVVLRASPDTAGPITRLEAAYRALLETRSARVAARLLDWAPEVEPEHALVVCPFFGGCTQHSLVHRACETGRADVLLEILARRGALPGFRAAMLDRDDARRLEMPLHAALAACDDGAESPAAVVRALLDAGAWHSPLDDDLRTPLHFAAMCGCAVTRCARLLLEAGADPADRDRIGSTPLHLAAEHGCACADACGVRALLEHACGADVASRDSFGCTPLHCARSAAAARRLLDAGADPHYLKRCSDSPLHLAAYYAPDVARVLLAAGADPNLRNIHGKTSLHGARNKAVVEMLVGAGAQLDAPDDDGQTPLSSSSECTTPRRAAPSSPCSSRPSSRPAPTPSQKGRRRTADPCSPTSASRATNSTRRTRASPSSTCSHSAPTSQPPAARTPSTPTAERRSTSPAAPAPKTSRPRSSRSPGRGSGQTGCSAQQSRRRATRLLISKNLLTLLTAYEIVQNAQCSFREKETSLRDPHYMSLL
jgi:hypothetical protein